MKLRIEAAPGEIAEKAANIVRALAAELVAHDPGLESIVKALDGLAGRRLWAGELVRAVLGRGPGSGPSAEAALTKTGVDEQHPVKTRILWNGMTIAIEERPGDVREWIGAGGQRGATLMRAPYGFIETVALPDSAAGELVTRPALPGADGDGYDCYLGSDPEAEFVYVVAQNKPDGTYDEDKAVLACAGPHEARAIYLAHRSDGERAYGTLLAIPVAEFKAKLLDPARMADGMMKASAAGASAARDGIAIEMIERPEVDPPFSSSSSSPSFVRSLLPSYGAVDSRMDDRAVSPDTAGGSGFMHVTGAPGRLVATMDVPSSGIGGDLKSSLEETVAAHAGWKPHMEQRDSFILTRPTSPASRWPPLKEEPKMRAEAGESARAEQPANKERVENKFKEKLTETVPQALHPKDARAWPRLVLGAASLNDVGRDVPAADPEPVTEPVTEPVAEPVTEPVTEPVPAKRVRRRRARKTA